jgi:valyl-tRNA synthetase
MPPPNITGILHLGHAYFGTLQDILVRFRRMQGRAVLWLPGTDHAGLATQHKLDAAMRKQGLDPHGPDFRSFAQTYKAGLQSAISGQLRSIGCSCDWSRERFTLDTAYSEAVTQALSRCHEAGMLSRSQGQWWLDMRALASQLLSALDRGEMTIMPAHGEKVLREFLANIEPWCISRQIRWGHRLPIWTLPDGSMVISDASPAPGAVQEEDVLDTWFSSSLWPFATLGWPQSTPDLERYYPADLIETGADILFFWCARMLMMGLLLTHRLAFRTIYLHGLILDKQGRKMSKSEGNGIDPLTVIRTWGTDALRISLAEDTTPGQDVRFDEERVRAGRALCTKLWNAARFALAHWNAQGRPTVSRPMHAEGDDACMLAEADAAIVEATEALDAMDFRRHALGLRHFLWDRMCSWYLETVKERLRSGDADALCTLMWTLDIVVHLMHPLAPFITERIHMTYSDQALISSDWPMTE